MWLDVGGLDVELIACLDEEEVLRLDVAVDDVDVVQVVHSRDHLRTPAATRAEERAVARERWRGSGGAGVEVAREWRWGGRAEEREGWRGSDQVPQHARGAAPGEQQLGVITR